MYTNEWIIITVVFFVLILVYRIGYRAGGKNNTNQSEGHFTRVSNIQAGLMGLLGVMLAFSFSLSAQRFEQRRQLIIQESINIGTSYFRAGLLPDSLKNDIRHLLRLYLNERIKFYRSGNTLNEMEEVQTNSENLQVRIWAKTAEIGKNTPNLNTNLNILSLNSMIDITGNISSSFQSRVPLFILFLLTFITISTILTIGYSDGLSLDRNTPFMILLNLVLCTILLLIIDLDTPSTGFLKSDIYSLLELREEIQRYDK